MPYAIPENVTAFLDKAAAKSGEIKAEEFGQFLWEMCCDKIESPIEQLFLIAIHLVVEENLYELSIAQEFDDTGDNLQIIPQWKVGNYSVDFALRQHPIDKIVCVELDGHDFHDRDERQRRYEKRRDRALQAAGYKVLHFTGSEVASDPCAVALEAFNLATNADKYSTHPFSEK